MNFLQDVEELNLLEVILMNLLILQAAQDGKLDFIKEQLNPLLSSSTKVKLLKQALNKRDFYGRNCLHYVAAYRGHYHVVQYFLDLQSQFLKINCQDNQGNTPLMLACIRGFNQEIQELNDKYHRKFIICKILVENGANLKMYQKNGINNPLHWACYFGDLYTTRLLLDHLPNLMLLQNDLDFFPIDHTLMMQKENQNTERDQNVAEYLILFYLIHFLKSNTHQTKLQDLIVQMDYNQSVPEGVIFQQELFQIKENINYEDNKLFSAMGHRYLYWASIIGRQDLVSSLISFNLSPFIRSYKGRNAVHAATFHGHLHLLKLFFESDFSKLYLPQVGGIQTAVNMMTEQQPETALHIAIQKGFKDIVSYLYALGADPEIHNYRNLTAFETTRDMQRIYIYQVSRVKQIKQSIFRQTKHYKRNVIRQGYKYLLVGRESQNQKDDLLFQQLVNIQQKSAEKGRFKVLILKGFKNHYLQSEEDPNEHIPHNQNLTYYLLKINHKLMNKIAEEEKMMVFNLREGIICRFIHAIANQYENFHHRHIQEIVMKLMNDEFDIEQFVSDGIITEHFPLHDFEEMKSIYQFWKKERIHILFEPFYMRKTTLRAQNALSTYYSIEVGFFFVFLTFFTSWLLIPAIPGIMLGTYIYARNDDNSPYVPIYIIFLAVWGTIFFEFWKRKQNEMAYELDMHIAKEQKKKIPQYKGQFSVEDVTHEIVIVDKRSEILKYAKSVGPLIVLGVSLISAQFYIFNQLLLRQEYNSSGQQKRQFYFIISYYTSIGYGLSIVVTNEIFYYFARLSLTIENHQFEDDKENIYILKVFSFTFINSYIRLLYRSVISPDSKELQMLTAWFSTVWAVIHIIRFNIFPMILYHIIKRRIFKKQFHQYRRQQEKPQHPNLKKRRSIYSFSSSLKASQDINQTESRNVEMLEKNFTPKQQMKTLRQIELSRNMIVQQDYIEKFTYLIIQFGNVAMFSSNFLFVPVIILVLNWINIEATILSYAKYVRRPVSLPKKGIGLWNDILLVVGYIATVINCLTIYTANQDQLTNLIGEADNEETYKKTQLRNFILLISAEHIVLGIKFVIEQVIPDVPEWVENSLKRQDYLEEKWHLKMKQPEQHVRQIKSLSKLTGDDDKLQQQFEDIKESSIILKMKQE